ncbi:MAG TPA: hypothetical protein VKR54_03700, partial [Candidatus Babeliales bacterium]|nr:hypothetical protein [Candidatus Babeliales bacterium]
NFKNISLFMLLTGFVGAEIHARDGFKEPMHLEDKLAYKQMELKGLKALNKAYSQVGIDAQYECSFNKKVEYEDSELCMYAKEIFEKKGIIYRQIMALEDEIVELNEDAEKLGLDIVKRDEELGQDAVEKIRARYRLEQDIAE